MLKSNNENLFENMLVGEKNIHSLKVEFLMDKSSASPSWGRVSKYDDDLLGTHHNRRNVHVFQSAYWFSLYSVLWNV